MGGNNIFKKYNGVEISLMTVEIKLLKVLMKYNRAEISLMRVEITTSKSIDYINH